MILKTLSVGATALMLAVPALAQSTTPPPAQPQQQQQQRQDSPAAQSPSAMNQGQIQFIQQQQAGQWLASRFMDRTVYGSDGNSIGDVNDVLVDSNGQVAAVVIGVGGFLGIGEKNVAVPFRSLQIQAAPARTTGDGTPSTTTQAPTPPAGQTTAAGDANLWSDRNARLVLRATRDELRNAPAFTEMDDRPTARTNTDNRSNEAPRGSPATPTTPAR